jgi:transcriptional regulator with XRE-family HTH domain
MNEAQLFGQRVRITRKARKMSLGQVAEKAGTGAKHLGRIERGEKLPSFELIIALASAMNASPSDFFQFEDIRADQKLLKNQVRELLQNRDTAQLIKAYRILKLLFEP